MSRFDRVMARRLERIVERRCPLKSSPGVPGGIGIKVKQHVRGDRWWRVRFAELVERRAAAEA